MVKIRILARYGPHHLDFEGGRFSCDFTPEEADALLCVYPPVEELARWTRTRAWYCPEPWTNPRMGYAGRPDWRRHLAGLQPWEILHHAHDAPRCRVPQVTHWRDPVVSPCTARAPRAVAIVSNHGGVPWLRWPEIRLRNRFATAARVDLYGDPKRWRWHRLPLLTLPASFRGPLPGGWGGDHKQAVMERYHAAICLENTCEPFYFTEKFLDAVMAGCVPIYRAHPTVRDTVLAGAAWVDPADFDDDVDATLDHALRLDRAQVAATNARWVQGDAVRATRYEAVFGRIGRLLAARVTETAAPR